ncbi:MAG: selenocysteine-specific translation elongation factor [Verrucomicrobiae bacterium]|nr:selenocysteine-specific translation elongation factor [Verrucomicrobiae bacterium]
MPEQINITLGTAGHVDHGKTALVKFLTGCDTDRLKEEKERGMSIELGFAPCLIHDLEVGIVDVPGHEHFVKTMVAGATGMDGVLLVVAADDGVMPQTREHLDILQLLGLARGIVALTKIDRVEAGQRAAATEQVKAILRGTFLENAPIFPLSNLTGEGYDAFREGLEELAASIPRRRTDGIFRLPVERAFAVKGFGTVVSGIPVAGQAGVGDELVLLPQGISGKLRSTQIYQQTGPAARAGQCAALNVPQWDHRQISRGDTIAAPGYFSPCEWHTAHLRLLRQEGVSLHHPTRLRFHTGTTDVPATVYLLAGNNLAGGDEAVVQFHFEKPLVAGPGDRFIIRQLNPVRTIGGGRLLEGGARRLRRNRPEIIQEVTAQAQAVTDESAWLMECLKKAEKTAPRLAELALTAKQTTEQANRILQRMVGEGKALALEGGMFLHAETARQTVAELLRLTGEFHRQSPASPGISPEQLQTATRLARPVLDPLLVILKKEGRLVERVAGRVALPEHRATLPDAGQAQLDQLENLFRQRPFQPPDPGEAATALRISVTVINKLIRILEENRRLIFVGEGLRFHCEAVERARQLLTDYIRREGRLESVKFKYLLDTTRKYALPLLDYFDRTGLTLRSNNTRYLRKQS